MIERKLSKLGGEVTRASLFLTRNLSSSITLERSLEKKSLDLKRKIVEDRGRILKRIGSRDIDSQRGGLGGALGLLGIGGGGGLLRRGLRRTPRSPSQLLRMQRGTSNLSRVGRLGKLARPLAVVGTGLDFIGRRAEGQSNVQAGVGAAGGLAGSIAGAKAGALFGTAIAGPLGTAVGGVGGAIIGSLAGGRIADLFTGANRRRRFEEERTIARTQKTLFSDALDDFDKVLDKFEDVAPALVLRLGGKDEEEGAAGSRKPRPPLPTPFFKRPAVRETRKVLTDGIKVAAVLALVVLAAKKGKIDPKTYTKILDDVLLKKPFLKNLSEKEQVAAIGRIIMRELPKSAQQKVRMNASPFLNKRGGVVPGQKGAPGKIKKKTNIVKKRRLEKEEAIRKAEDLKESGREFRQLQEIKSTSELIREFIRTGELPGSSTPADIKRGANLVFDLIKEFQASGMIDAKQLKAVKTLKRLLERKIFRLENPKFDKNLKNIKKDTPKFNREDFQSLDDLFKIFEETPTPLGSLPKDQRLDPLDTTGSSNIALVPRNNIFVINQAPSNQVNIVEDTNDITMIGGTENSFASLNKYAEFTSVAFTT